MYYNADKDYYVCPCGQHLEHIGDEQITSDLGYVSTISKYRTKNCDGCPFWGMCHKTKGNRVIEVNHKADEYREKAKERLTSEEGLYHRSMRPIEPEAVFGDINTTTASSASVSKAWQKSMSSSGVFSPPRASHTPPYKKRG